MVKNCSVETATLNACINISQIFIYIYIFNQETKHLRVTYVILIK